MATATLIAPEPGCFIAAQTGSELATARATEDIACPWKFGRSTRDLQRLPTWAKSWISRATASTSRPVCPIISWGCGCL